MHRLRDSSLTTRGMVFVSGGLTLALGGLLVGYADVARVGFLLTVLPLVALALTHRRTPQLRVRRTVEPETLVPDQRGQVLVTISNESAHRSSGMYLAEEQVDYVLGDRPRFLLPALAPRAARQLRYTIRSDQRGLHRLGPIRLQQTDPFGLTSGTHRLPETTQVLILPRVVPLGITRPPGVGTGSDGDIPQLVALHGSDDVNIRAYRDGDDLRKVHWPATAHRGDLMVRQEEQPTRRSALILLDARAGANVGTGPRSSFEWTVSAAASIATRLQQLQYVLRLATCESMADDTLERPLSATAVVHRLASVRTCSDPSHDALVTRASALVSAGAVVVVMVTDRDDALVDQVAAMRSTGAAGIAFVLDTASFARTGAAPSGPARAVQDRLATAGWRVTTVRGDTRVEQAWAVVAARNTARVGVL